MIRETCCACTSEPVALVHDGGHRKPVCSAHAQLYATNGYTITPSCHDCHTPLTTTGPRCTQCAGPMPQR